MFDNVELVLQSRGHGDPQACRQERETLTHGSERREVLIFSGPEIRGLLCQVATSLRTDRLRRLAEQPRFATISAGVEVLKSMLEDVLGIFGQQTPICSSKDDNLDSVFCGGLHSAFLCKTSEFMGLNAWKIKPRSPSESDGSPSVQKHSCRGSATSLSLQHGVVILTSASDVPVQEPALNFTTCNDNSRLEQRRFHWDWPCEDVDI